MKKKIINSHQIEKNIIVNKKYLYNFYDVYINKLQKKGTYFFGITINLLDDLNETSRILNKTPEQLILKLINNIQLILKNVEAVDFSLTSIEIHKKNQNKAHLHMIVGVRSITENPKHVKTHIEDIFQNTKIYYDIQIDYLKYFINIKRYFVYISKEFNKINNFCNDITFITFSQQNKIIHNELINHFEELQEKNMIVKQTNINQDFNTINRYFKYNQIKGKFEGVPSFNFQIKKKNQNIVILIYYINLYLILNDMFLNNENLYIKNKGSLCSYTYLDDFYYLLSNVNDITQFFQNNFETVDFYHFQTNVLNNIKKIENLFKNYTKLIYNKKVNYNIIEFSDGLYIMEFDAFIKKENLSNENINEITCIRYYNQTYKNINDSRKYLPKTWIKYLNKNIEKEKLNTFLADFGKYFYYENDVTKNKNLKNNSLFIQGNASTGKTSLLTNQLINAWGEEHIASITHNTNFAMETIKENSKIILNDEFEYDSKHRSDLLKILDNQEINQNIKFKNITKIKHNANTLFLGNYTTNNNKMLQDIAFQKRLDIYHFQNELKISKKELLKIKREEPKIILLCHKFFLNKYKKRNKKRLNKNNKNKIIKEITK